MKTEGVGGRKPIADPENRDDWWKDRRVEFILNK
jgi:outer membrane protein OmpA-like peptidoglycan-associated protein